MEALDIVRRSLVDAGRLVRSAEQAAQAQRGRLVVRSRKLQAERETHIDAAADLRFKARLWNSFSLIPGTAALSRRFEMRCQAEIELRRGVDQRLEAINATIRSVDQDAKRCRKTFEHIGKATRALTDLGHPPRDIADQARVVQTRIIQSLRGKRADQWHIDAEALARQAVEVVRNWAQAKVIADARRREAAITKPAILGANGLPARGQPIFLPIPATLSPMAERLGARRDPQSPQGASPWFVTRDMDLAPFKDMLPLAYRPVPTPFDYFPIPIAASSQNLWGVMSKDSWSHIRRSVYASSGHRCVICGGRGKGFIADAISQPEERRQTIEAHEVWDWSVPSMRTGIGVQKLKKVLTLCPNCHAMFHEAHFVRMARVNGLDAEVREAIEKRRMLVNRVGHDALSSQLLTASNHLKSLASIDTWVVDLSHLSEQQFMAHATVTMMEGNRAGLPAERIAGIDFTTDSGRDFQARSAQSIVAELTDTLEQRWQQETSTVVPFRKR